MPSEPHKPDEPGDTDRALDASDAVGAPGLFAGLGRHLRYSNAYAWLLLFSALDVMLTWTILHFAGSEVNPIANRVIDNWGLNGMIVYKFALVTVFILICELVGALRESTGRSLSRISVLIASAPVAWSLVLLLAYSRQ